ncbi:cytoskeleton-associated protein 2 isoform X2 [Neoarius graeffei]|uniref:cytoskeleton-associated protein 2 isoform X2 n=1 Tax=Neoarius graeffei TaxID=443677 RepID=UPI00298C9E98|nr:cytoskeleton-associated protein 2 isoform X2 [Neoarius graeffei]
MDTVVKKSNKENSKPDVGQKKAEFRNVVSKRMMKSAPLQFKNALREENAGDNKAESKVRIKPSKLTKSNNSDPTQRKTLSQAFRTEQTLRHRKLVLETQKPPPSVPPKSLLPGTYKGRVVQSKIDCFRKPPSGHEKKPSENKPKAETVVRSKPATVLSVSSRVGVQSSLESRAKSGLDTRVKVQKTVPQRQIQTKTLVRTATVSAKPSAVSAKSSTISRKPVTMSARPPTVTSFIKKKEPSKPATAAREQKPQKSVSSSISQYRIRVESAEERRAKLAEWLALKGKTLKRPAMTEKSAPPSCKPQTNAEDADKAQPKVVTVSEAEQSEVPQRKPAFSNSPSHILNTTLDLLDNSDTELPTEPEVVVNLCKQLEAMETPSSCESETKAGRNAEVKTEEEMAEYEILEEEELGEEKPKDIAEEEDGEEEKRAFRVNEEEEQKLFEGGDEEKMDSTPADVVDAFVVKYSVKTTPFLQSVKKRMEGELAPATPGSRRKSSIKELKFLTPVRRSSRIHRNSSRLPDVLNEHDPCVSSLAELELLDAADSNAYIYRKNPALLQHLPEQRPEPQSSDHTDKQTC